MVTIDFKLGDEKIRELPGLFAEVREKSFLGPDSSKLFTVFCKNAILNIAGFQCHAIQNRSK